MDYKKVLGNNSYHQNFLALNLLLDKGREAMCDDDFYKELMNYAETNPSNFLSVEYQKEYIKIAKDMSKLETNELLKFIKDEIRVLKNKDMER